MTKITVGADPEVFLGKKGMFVSAHNLLPGTKHRPHPVTRGAVQVDGMAAEFNIAPAEDEQEFINNLDVVLQQLQEMVPEYELLHQATVQFPKEFLKDIPPEALELGCEPDFSAYTRGVNARPDAGALMRTAGGHIHIGGWDSPNPYETFHFNDMCRLMKAMDETVGVYSLFWDNDDKRRAMYGKPGTFRPKTYGAEYRTLSNAWLFNKKVQSFVYRGVVEAVAKMEDPSWMPNTIFSKIINRNDRDSTFFQKNTKYEEIRDIMASA